MVGLFCFKSVIRSICTKPFRGSFNPRSYNGFELNGFFDFICSFFDRSGKFPLYRNKQPCDVNSWNYDEKRKWILYPYSSLHARMKAASYTSVLSIIPPTILTFWLLFNIAFDSRQIFILDCCGTIDSTLVIYLEKIRAIETAGYSNSSTLRRDS